MKNWTHFSLAMAAILSLTATTVYAADAENGRKLARQCSVCHGKIGISRGDPEVPNLAGQSSLYIEKSLKDFRSGIREDRRMTLLAKGLSDADIKDLSAWFASIQITAVAPD